ncbi:MAG TPA: ATP-binding protein [Candidatus Eremiobacteraeota bacterium]|nr:ATP-binding protein [Candidatus Eremiobacteraeota bacterium]
MQKIKKILQDNLLLLGIIMTLILISVNISYTWNDYIAFSQITDEELRLQELGGIINYLNEMFTTSTLMGVITGDLNWEEKYRSYKPEYDKAIEEFIKLSSGSSNDKIRETEKIHEELFKIENETFKLIKLGQIEKANKLIYSDEYLNKKEIYTKSIQKIIRDTIEERIEKEKINFSNKLSKDIIFSAITLLVLLSGWSGVIIRFRKQIEAYQKAEKALKESEQRYHAIGELIPFGVWVFNPDGGVIYLSDSFRRLLGISLEESKKSGWLDRISKIDAERILTQWKKCVKIGSFWDYLFHLTGKDGKEYAILSRGVPIRDEEGNITSWAGINLDITEREKMEMELRKSRDDLEKRVAERTLELQKANETLKEEISERKRAEGELDRRKKELEEINKELISKNDELDEFAYMVSQDLREPLRNLIATGNNLKNKLQEGISEETKIDLNRISSISRGMALFIQDLLTLCKGGKNGLRYELFPLDECVEQALYSLAVRIEETKATIKRDPLPDIFGDRMLLTHLYQNLIENAINYVQEGPPVIELTSEKTEKGLVLGVKDNGTGIDKEYIDAIFKPFKRDPSQELFCRTGIGLGIARKAVEQHGGKIWVESNGGKGAHFRFTLG